MSIEYTDDIHPRNAYWEMWGLPMFDIKVEDSENVLREVRAAREAFPEHYIKLIAYDPTYTRQTTALSFIVNRPSVEKEFKLDRIQGPGRVNSYRLAVKGSRYGAVAARRSRTSELRFQHASAASGPIGRTSPKRRCRRGGGRRLPSSARRRHRRRARRDECARSARSARP